MCPSAVFMLILCMFVLLTTCALNQKILSPVVILPPSKPLDPRVQLQLLTHTLPPSFSYARPTIFSLPKQRTGPKNDSHPTKSAEICGHPSEDLIFFGDPFKARRKLRVSGLKAFFFVIFWSSTHVLSSKW